MPSGLLLDYGATADPVATLASVVNFNGTDHRLCLLDTNALSEIAKGDATCRHFLTWSSATKPTFVPCFSLFSVLEMRRRPAVYQRFLEFFRVFPCLMLKSHEELLEEEVRCYPDPTSVDPIALGFSLLGGEGMDLSKVFGRAGQGDSFRTQERYWNDAQDEIVEGICSLVTNFPPGGDKYSRAEVRTFIELAGFSQIAMRQYEFADSVVGKGEAVKIQAFPSIKATTYTVWHKFYADRTRKPVRSDAFDIIISAPTPYVDAVITESHQAESLSKTQRHDAFIDHLLAYTLKDFRHSPPASFEGSTKRSTKRAQGSGMA